MIIVDFSQILIATLMSELGNNPHDIKVDENLVRHMALNSIRANKMKFAGEFGEVVIACDDKTNWRKKVFPYYKANRKKSRDESGLDWTSLFETINNIREELKEFFPYRVIQVDNAEADDVIASLVKEFHAREKILILSGDKDFQQLQKHPNVKQYSPVLKRYIECKNPELFLAEHILRGDVDDGVPNFLSADNCLVMKIRQTPISTKKLESWILQDPSKFCSELVIKNYTRNQKLIDLSEVPEEIERETIAQYNSQKKNRSKLFNYFISRELKNLLESINDF